MKIGRNLLLGIFLASGCVTFAQSSEPSAVQMRPFVVAAPGIDIKLMWQKRRSDGADEIAFILITKVVPDSAAFRVGLRKDMRIVAINGTRVGGLNRAGITELLNKPTNENGEIPIVIAELREKQRIQKTFLVPSLSALETKKRETLGEIALCRGGDGGILRCRHKKSRAESAPLRHLHSRPPPPRLSL